MIKYTNSKQGAEGIGTLIIFIAMVLVAAIAAGVLIQTGSNLQSKSLDIGKQSQEKLTTDIEVIQIYANDTNNGAINAGVDKITFIIRLSSGSSPIKLGDMLIRFDVPDGSQSLVSSNSTTYSTSLFGTDYKMTTTAHKSGYLSPGDLAEISFTYDGPKDIIEGETLTLRLITKNGAIKPIQITTPSALVDKIVYLYP